MLKYRRATNTAPWLGVGRINHYKPHLHRTSKTQGKNPCPKHGKGHKGTDPSTSGTDPSTSLPLKYRTVVNLVGQHFKQHKWGWIGNTIWYNGDGKCNQTYDLDLSRNETYIRDNNFHGENHDQPEPLFKNQPEEELHVLLGFFRSSNTATVNKNQAREPRIFCNSYPPLFMLNRTSSRIQ